MSPTLRRYASTCLVMLCLAVLAGCKQPIYTRLSEAEANDVLLTLIKGGVDAQKRAGEEGTFSVLVPEAEIATAIELLRADAQPSEHYSNLGEVFARNNLVSSPTEERIRFIYGLQQELARTLSQIDGVLVARVHIVVPASDPFQAAAEPSSASVFLKHRADINMQLVVPAVKDLVVRSVEGLSADSVSVSLFPARATITPPAQVPVTRFFGALVASSSVLTLWIVFIVPWIFVALLTVMLLHATRVREGVTRWIERRRTRRNGELPDNVELPNDERQAA
ncbi:MAG: type III secretion system inner membrane ring lipoprotein SctJ [Steroidobacter sp.]